MDIDCLCYLLYAMWDSLTMWMWLQVYVQETDWMNMKTTMYIHCGLHIPYAPVYFQKAFLWRWLTGHLFYGLFASMSVHQRLGNLLLELEVRLGGILQMNIWRGPLMSQKDRGNCRGCCTSEEGNRRTEDLPAGSPQSAQLNHWLDDPKSPIPQPSASTGTTL